MTALLGANNVQRKVLLILSPLLCIGLCAPLKYKRVSFILWLFLTRVLVDIYSGEVSSRLISPLEEKTLHSFPSWKSSTTRQQVLLQRKRIMQLNFCPQ